MRYYAPNEQLSLTDPTPDQLEQVLRTSPYTYWQEDGNAEAILDAGPGGSIALDQATRTWAVLSYLLEAAGRLASDVQWGIVRISHQG